MRETEAQPRDVADVVAALTAIGEGLPAGDGVAAFNRMYLLSRSWSRRGCPRGSSATRPP